MASRIDFYETYFKNLSPTTFNVRKENDEIIISGFCKAYPKDFKTTDIKQYPVNQEKFNKGGSNTYAEGGLISDYFKGDLRFLNY